MMLSKKNIIPPINRQTVVIAGASSGIGRATVLEFARRGAKLVLASRQLLVLNELVGVCKTLGAEAIAVVTDVTDADAVQRLALAAVEFGGRIDVWVNNAGVGVVGEFTEVPADVHDQVIRTNLMGYMHGAHAALPYFKQQQYGILINTISIGAWFATPFWVAYTASKYGLRGFSEALRGELNDYPDIHVCDVFPSFIDTPGTHHAANYTGKKLKPVPPVFPAYRVAQVIVSMAEHPKSSEFVGATAILAKGANTVAPKLSRWLMTRFMETYFKHADSVPVTNGNLYEPTGRDTGISGGWISKNKSNLPLKIAGIAGVAAMAGVFLLSRKVF